MESKTASTLAITTSSVVDLPVALFPFLSPIITKTSASAFVPPVMASILYSLSSISAVSPQGFVSHL